MNRRKSVVYEIPLRCDFRYIVKTGVYVNTVIKEYTEIKHKAQTQRSSSVYWNALSVTLHGIYLFGF